MTQPEPPEPTPVAWWLIALLATQSVVLLWYIAHFYDLAERC